jgi:hypothetical protein
MAPARPWFRIEDIVITTVVFLVASLRNTGGTVIQGADSREAWG